jgi:DNA processing protein
LDDQEGDVVKEQTYWLAWSQVAGVGAILLQRLQQHFGDLKTAWEADIRALGEVEGLGEKNLIKVREARSRLNPDQFLEQYLQQNPNFWTPADPDYPRLLLEIPSPPPVLHYQGSLNLTENQGIQPLIGIVGTRHPTEHGKRWTRKISKTLTQKGFTIVSGMAAGIDAEAHLGCLQGGGRTIAVLGTGLDLVYPPSNRKLYHQIQQQGLLLSEYPAGRRPDKGNFPARNRIVAGLCRAILVIEAPQRSGALITARLANEFGRDIFALPNSPDVQQAQGCLQLINRGAYSIESEEYLLEMLGTIPDLDTEVQLSLFDAPSPPPDLSPELRKVYEALASETLPFDLIIEKTAMDAGAVSSSLLQLELEGLVSQLPGMRYQRS